MYESWINKPWQYLKTRFPAHIFLPCAAFLVVAGIAGGRTMPPADMAPAFAIALTLLLQFRLLDDLSDLSHDRRVYPERVLTQVASLVPFSVLLVACILFNFVLIALQPGPSHRLIYFLLLNAVALLWHFGLRDILNGNILRFHIVILKYPLFVFFLSGDSWNKWHLFLSMAVVYLCFSMYEALHDRHLRTVQRAATSLAAEIGALFAVSVLMTVATIRARPSIMIVQGMLGLLSFLVMSDLFLRRRVHLESAKSGYVVFILGFILVFNFTIGVRL